MRLQVLFPTVLAAAASTSVVAQTAFVGATGAMTFDKTTQVPGDTMKAGSYRISVPEQIADRVIVRIDSTNSKDHAIFLGVPSTAAKVGGGGGASQWPNGVNSAPALRGFVFPSGEAIEFVYPKAEAAALAKNNSAAVVAVDPSSEGRAQLKSLSKDELEIVNLWLLSLTTAGPDGKQPAVLAQHYEPAKVAPTSTVASAYPATPQRDAQSAVTSAQVTPSVAAPVPTKEAEVSTAAIAPPMAALAQPAPQAKRVKVTQPATKAAPEVAKLEQPEGVKLRRGPAMTQLPHTASSLPAVWVAGVLSLLGFGAIRYGRSRSTRLES